MTFSYDENALSISLNRIRLEIGDTDEDRILLKDEEVEQIISEQTSFSLQVVACCKLIAAQFARHPEHIVLEGFEETTKEIYNRYVAMAKEWSRKSGSPWAASIDVDLKESNELDTTTVQGRFKLGMHNNG